MPVSPAVRSLLLCVSLAWSALLLLGGCRDATAPAGGEGEGEGEGEGQQGGEGEGEGQQGGEGEGEGEGQQGGEGEGEGEGQQGGEGEGEGEGQQGGEGEGEGEGDPGDVCDDDTDCAGGTVCLFADPDNDGFVLDGVCGAPGPGAAAGAVCATSADCDRGLCSSNFCSQLCTTTCPTNMACEFRSFRLANGDGGTAQVCVPDGSLPATPCTSDADCAATGRVCNEVVGTTSLSLQCGFPGAGAALGGTCSAQFLDDRTVCQSGLCDGEGAGMCTRACVDNADCGAGLVCSGSMFSNLAGDFCADPCLADADCPSGRTCQLRTNRAGTGEDTVCATPFGPLPAGAPTADPAQCATNIGTLNGLCTQLCSSDASCTSPVLPVCLPVTLSGTTQQVNVCQPRG